MTSITEPSMMVLCSEMVELTNNHELVAEQMRSMGEFGEDLEEDKYAAYRDKYDHLKTRAEKNLRKFNRRTLSN